MAEDAEGDIVASAPGYRIEGGGSQTTAPEAGVILIDEVFDLADNDYAYYQEHFVGKDHHRTFVSNDTESGPYAISMVAEDGGSYRTILRTKKNNFRKTFDGGDVYVPCFRGLTGSGPDVPSLVSAVDPDLPAGSFREIRDNACHQTILRMEQRQLIQGFKFGILYAEEDQKKEDEIFSNENGSPAFEEFLDFLGDRIQLQNWANFRGGLDVNSGSTGETAIYTNWRNLEIIYHVSTMLPHSVHDTQQLERKRHIGNDLVVIVWQEGNTKYRPSTISSRQVHVVFLVKEVKKADDPEGKYYQLAVISRDGVPAFGPELPKVAVYKRDDEFRELFYTKLLNAEKACYKAPMIDTKLERTRTLLLKDLEETYR
eukprot:CAMPEP_0201510570 /NCGR_PEP_ID=MMETSP0161_2-20130828/3201_1 /ASSEMBLY_ACC=CAM_ASM_000251 /TAXON_ID=180227 /ORGANISM="Neoparamoeba aestuarina, Strain SoJaBio B1-5/56/2" /LENGTH=370 /DNA_ID=CAMNT_0047905759 /DNA_START=26 /DNA_END=1138 /DNA_ORIENTATION=-